MAGRMRFGTRWDRSSGNRLYPKGVRADPDRNKAGACEHPRKRLDTREASADGLRSNVGQVSGETNGNTGRSRQCGQTAAQRPCRNVDLNLAVARSSRGDKQRGISEQGRER